MQLDINRASIDKLSSVEGVSTSVAEAIVDYIETHGPVETINQLEDVEGVGPATIDKLKSTFGAKVQSASATSLAMPVGFRPQVVFEYWWNHLTFGTQ
ncbi:MAG: helix-hairpin-helix domain-containing protein [Alphaproteobacteria bacterium]|nr:helix-hairpin-helix domain-containing protein [Alphaproteobacteria bacterium]